MTAAARRPYSRAAFFALAALLLAACQGASAEDVTVRAEPAFDGEVFDLPVDLVALPDGGYLLAEKPGRVLRLDAEGAAETVLDITSEVATGHEELGLLSLALDPTFADSGILWVQYMADAPLRNVVARYRLDESGAHSPVVVLEVPQPFENHNGGGMRFGPDGMLYLGFGDGGAAFDPQGNGQETSTLLSCILRIDVSPSLQLASGEDAPPYRIPPDNPFAGGLVSGGGDEDARPEVWAYGLRNPWRFDFDPETGDLWVGDVGQDHAEEVNLVRTGGNYGWSLVEGDHCRADACDASTFEPPVTFYTHAEGCAVTGGIVVRDGGPLDGRFVYGDLCSGTIWAVDAEGVPQVLTQVDGPIVSFAEDHDGSVLVLRFGAPVLRLVVE